MEYQWLISLVTAVVTGVVVALFTQWLSYRFQTARFFQEKLLDYHATFLESAITELVRAKAIEATYATSKPFANEGAKDDPINRHLVALEEERHALHRKLLQVGIKIRLLETDEKIKGAIGKLSLSQPFLVFGRWGEGNFVDRFDKFQKEIVAYKQLIDDTIEMVFRKYNQGASVREVVGSLANALPKASASSQAIR